MLHSLQHSYDQIHIVITWHGQVNFLIVPVYDLPSHLHITTDKTGSCRFTFISATLRPPLLTQQPNISWRHPGHTSLSPLPLSCHRVTNHYRIQVWLSPVYVPCHCTTVNVKLPKEQRPFTLLNYQFSFVLIRQILTILDRMWWKTKVEYLS